MCMKSRNKENNASLFHASVLFSRSSTGIVRPALASTDLFEGLLLPQDPPIHALSQHQFNRCLDGGGGHTETCQCQKNSTAPNREGFSIEK